MTLAVFITVAAQFSASHSYADAPHEVGFLQFPHRHLFKVKVSIKVDHDDRESEFFLVQKSLEGFITGTLANRHHPNQSCEMLAKTILKAMRIPYPKTFMVEVSEDGENAATVVDIEG